jgi:hypothetical protein
MAALDKCRHCAGFLPPRTGNCPHCGAAAPKGLLRGLGRSIFAVTGGGAIAITLMACYGAAYGPPVEPTPDANRCAPTATDKDGDCVAAPEDCNDEDPAIHPGAPDPLGDDIDQNCDDVDGVAG